MEEGARLVTPTEWITASVAVLALLLSGYNTLTQRKDRALQRKD